MPIITAEIVESDLDDLSLLFDEFAATHGSEFKGDKNTLRTYLLDEKISKCFLCRSYGKAVGFLLFTPMLATFKSRPVLFVNSVYVNHDSRNSAAFLSLMLSLKKYARNVGAAWIDGIVSDDNPMKQSLESLGRNQSKWHYVGRTLK